MHEEPGGNRDIGAGKGDPKPRRPAVQGGQKKSKPLPWGNVCPLWIKDGKRELWHVFGLLIQKFWGQRNSLLSFEMIQEKTSDCQPEKTLWKHIFRQKSIRNILFFGPPENLDKFAKIFTNYD